MSRTLCTRSCRRLVLGALLLCSVASQAGGQAGLSPPREPTESPDAPRPLAPSSFAPPFVEPAARTLHTWAEARHVMARHQPSLREQRAALIAAHAEVTQALSRLLPTLEVGAGADYSLVRPAFFSVDQPASHELFAERSLIPNATASFAITFSLDALAAQGSARAGVVAERHALAAQRHALVASLASTVLAVLGAERVAARNLAGLQAAEQRMRLAQRLVELGRATELDAIRFAQDLNEARSNVVEANEALSQAREALGSALGLTQAVALAPQFDTAQLTSPRSSGCQPIAELVARPARRAARARQRQAELAEDAAGLAYLPELRLISQYVASYAPTSAVTFEGERGVLHNWIASANLVWTLYDGGVRSAASQRAGALAVSARAERDAAALESVSEARRARRLLAVAQATVDIARRELEQARKLDSLSRKALELGKASALEAVDAARRLRVTEITLAVREVELIAARVRAQMAMAICR